MVAIRGIAIRFYTHNPVPVNMHYRDLFVSYRELLLASCRPVGICEDSNVCSCLLSPTAPAPRSRCIGEQVARFARPLESRPVDPVRRELYRWLAATPSGISSTSGWVAPAAPLPVSPILLAGGTEDAPPPPQECQGPRASIVASARHPAALENRA